MLKKLIKPIILAGSSLLIIAGVILLWWLMSTEDERNVINVRLENGATETVSFESLGLIPGEECSYTLVLSRSGAKEYDVQLDFEENKERAEQTLKNFARVKILAGDEVLYDDLLAAAFEKEDIALPVDLREVKKTELQLVYYMPIEVGNEAKNAEAIFELRITASNE